MNKLKTLTAAIAFATLATATTGVLAQQTSSQPPASHMASEPTKQVSDAQLEMFVNASKEVAAIHTEYSEKFDDATNQSKAQKLQQEAQNKMLEAVQDSGLDAATYNELAARMQADPDLRERADNL